MGRVRWAIIVFAVMVVVMTGAVAIHTVRSNATGQVLLGSQRAQAVTAQHAQPAAATGTATPQASASGNDCPGALFVGARGSGEFGPGSDGWPRGRTTKDPWGLGGEVNEIYQQAETELGKSNIGQPLSVNYGADRVETILHDPAEYFDDLSAGVSWTLKNLQEAAQSCPAQEIVLAGYSQGAMVMHRVLHQLENTATDQQILSRVVAAVLIGDGDQVPLDNETRYGSAWPTAMGIGQVLSAVSGSSVTKFAPGMGTQVLRVCNRGDIVCDYMTALAAPAGLATGVGTHLSYAGSRPLRQASEQAARDLLAIRYNGAGLEMSGTVGIPMSASATVTGGALPLMITGGIDGTAPSWAGISESDRTVTVSGTPTSAGSWTFDVAVQDAKGDEVTIPVSVTVASPTASPSPVPSSTPTGTGSWTAAAAPLPANAVLTDTGGVGLTSVACPSASSCVATGRYVDSSGGQQGLLVTKSGSAWTAAAALLPAGAAADPDVELNSVACPSASWCVAAGYYTDSSGSYQGLLITGSGTTWTATKAPVPGGGAADLSASLLSVACSSASSCVAVGSYEEPSGAYQGLLVTGSGTTWAAATAPVPANADSDPGVALNAVACTSASSCTAAGSYDASSSAQGLLLTGSGTTWTASEAPPVAGGWSTASLGSVACPSASSCVAVGYYSPSAASGAMEALVVAGSGTAWASTEVSLPGSASVDPFADLQSIACPSVSSCVAVGGYVDSTETNQGLLVTGAGTTWKATEAPVPSAYLSTDLYSVACSSPSSCVAAGYYSTASGYSGLLETGSGTAWTAIEAPQPSDGDSGSPDVSPDSAACPSTCTVVGRYSTLSGNWQELLLTGPS